MRNDVEKNKINSIN